MHKNRSVGHHCCTKFSRDNCLVDLVNFDKVTCCNASERPTSWTTSLFVTCYASVNQTTILTREMSYRPCMLHKSDGDRAQDSAVLEQAFTEEQKIYHPGWIVCEEDGDGDCRPFTKGEDNDNCELFKKGKVDVLINWEINKHKCPTLFTLAKSVWPFWLCHPLPRESGALHLP
jgi:hypothetical protein